MIFLRDALDELLEGDCCIRMVLTCVDLILLERSCIIIVRVQEILHISIKKTTLTAMERDKGAKPIRRLACIHTSNVFSKHTLHVPRILAALEELERLLETN